MIYVVQIIIKYLGLTQEQFSAWLDSGALGLGPMGGGSPDTA